MQVKPKVHLYNAISLHLISSHLVSFHPKRQLKQKQAGPSLKRQENPNNKKAGLLVPFFSIIIIILQQDYSDFPSLSLPSSPPSYLPPPPLSI